MAFGFGKKKRGATEQTAATVEATEGQSEAVDEAAAVEQARGPWDIEEAPEGERYLNLGSLWLPARQDVTLKLQVNAERTAVSGLTASFKDSSLELVALAAPKSGELWDDIRQELLQADAAASEQEGPFGQEIVSSVSLGGGKTIPTRIVGVDGPRWFLRGIFTGQAARQGEQKDVLDEFFSAVVVDRGGEPVAPRDPLPLHPPIQAPDPVAEAADGEPEQAPDLPGRPDGPLTPTQQVDVQQTLSRGPMFSEIR